MMNGGHVAVGTGLAVWGAALYAACTWYVRADARMSEQQWSARYLRSQRSLVKWGFTPVIVWRLALSVITIVGGLTST